MGAYNQRNINKDKAIQNQVAWFIMSNWMGHTLVSGYFLYSKEKHVGQWSELQDYIELTSILFIGPINWPTYVIVVNVCTVKFTKQ